MRIAGSHIILTGASSGIGEALARELDRRGAKLALVSRSRPPLGAHLFIAADLAVPAQRERAAAEALDALGHVDVLINNAGIGLYAPSWQTDMTKAMHMFEVNFFAAVDLTQRLVPRMIERRRGRIVNVASIASKVTLPWMTLYSASKAALESFTRGLRIELKNTGVGATLVCPGYVKTAFQASVIEGQPPPKLAHNKRFASTSEEVARAIAHGIERNSRTVLTPSIGWGFVAASRMAPDWLDGRLRAMMDDAAKD